MDSSQYANSFNLPSFIEMKIRNSEWFHVTGDIDAITNTIEYVPASGKTAFLFEAKIVVSTHVAVASISAGSTSQNVTANNIVKAALKIDSTTKDTTQHGMISGASSGSAASGYGGAGSAYAFTDGRFNCLGLSLEGNGVKKIEIENTLDAGSAIATMSGWLSDT